MKKNYLLVIINVHELFEVFLVPIKFYSIVILKKVKTLEIF